MSHLEDKLKKRMSELSPDEYIDKICNLTQNFCEMAFPTCSVCSIALDHEMNELLNEIPVIRSV